MKLIDFAKLFDFDLAPYVKEGKTTCEGFRVVIPVSGGNIVIMLDNSRSKVLGIVNVY